MPLRKREGESIGAQSAACEPGDRPWGQSGPACCGGRLGVFDL